MSMKVQHFRQRSDLSSASATTRAERGVASRRAGAAARGGRFLRRAHPLQARDIPIAVVAPTGVAPTTIAQLRRGGALAPRATAELRRTDRAIDGSARRRRDAGASLLVLLGARRGGPNHTELEAVATTGLAA